MPSKHIIIESESYTLALAFVSEDNEFVIGENVVYVLVGKNDCYVNHTGVLLCLISMIIYTHASDNNDECYELGLQSAEMYFNKPSLCL